MDDGVVFISSSQITQQHFGFIMIQTSNTWLRLYNNNLHAKSNKRRSPILKFSVFLNHAPTPRLCRSVTADFLLCCLDVNMLFDVAVLLARTVSFKSVVQFIPVLIILSLPVWGVDGKVDCGFKKYSNSSRGLHALIVTIMGGKNTAWWTCGVCVWIQRANHWDVSVISQFMTLCFLL